MSVESIFNYETGETNLVKDERYKNVGGDTFQLGTVKRAFIEADFSIQLNDSNGTELEVDVDYEFTNKDTEYTSLEGVDVWTGITILNAVYELGILYITYRALGSYTDGDFIRNMRDDVDTLQAAAIGTNILTKTASYDILDADLESYGNLIIYANPISGIQTYGLPTLADNIGKIIRIEATDLGGKITVDGEGAETINFKGTSKAALYLQSAGDYLEVIGEAGEWQILGYSAKYETGWINRSDYNTVHAGTMAFDVDNRNPAGAFTIGEVITADSGVTGIVQSDDLTTIYVKNVTGVGFFVNNEEIVGSESAKTADVDEAGTGNSKNQDTDLLHEFGVNLSDLKVSTFISTDGTENNSLKQYSGAMRDNSARNGGITNYQTDTNNIKQQTGSGGTGTINDAGTAAYLEANDYYIKNIIEVFV